MEEELVILDFETSGLSPSYSRIIEVGAVIIKGQEILESFSALCKPNIPISYEITSITGITNQMLEDKPPPEEVIKDFCEFIGDRPLLAHNASFDSRFLKSEMEHISRTLHNPFLCTLLLARRLIPNAINHKLGSLKRHIGYQEEEGHQDHRALDDVKVTASLWIHLKSLVEEKTGQKTLDFSVYQALSRISKYKIEAKLESLKEYANK
jgi:DNA polymerase-3 subunit epsilon